MYKLTIVHATNNEGIDIDVIEFDMFSEMQDYILENNIENYGIEWGA